MPRIPLWRRYARLAGADPRADIDDELRFHIETRAEDLVSQGWDREAARREAERQFGDLPAVRRHGEAIAVRRERIRERRNYWAAFCQDVRYALRGMRRSPAFTTAVLLTLALGTGAISTVFTLANTLFFRRLPVDRADRVVVVQATRLHGRWPGWVSYPEYLHFRNRAATLQGLAAHYSNVPLYATLNHQPRELTGAVVSQNFFPLLGLHPALGRFFRPEEDAVPDRDRVAVLGYRAWRDWFGLSPDVLGAPLRINGAVFILIGVAPESFRGATVQPDDVYLPAMMSGIAFRWCPDSLALDCRPFSMIGRLAGGRSAAQANAEFSTLLPAAWASASDDQNSGIQVLPARGVYHPDISRGEQRRFVELLAAVAAILLLVCCINLSGLMMARNSARTREFAIRSSLGAGSGRLMRQLVTESVLLAIGGGLVGLACSLALTQTLNALFYSLDFSGHPLYYNFNPEPRILLAVLAVSITSGLLVGLLPALRSLHTDASEALKRQSAAVSGRPRFGRWLAGVQAAAAVALTAIAGLLAAGAHSLLAGNNFDSSHVALMRLRPRLASYTPERAQQFVRSAIDRLESLPAVESATMGGPGAILVGNNTRVSLPGRPDLESVACSYLRVGPRYFETLRTPLLRGREFDRRDTQQTPAVAIASEALARKLWPGGAAIGAIVFVDGKPRRVVGVVSDISLANRGDAGQPYVYTAFWQYPGQIEAQLAVRVKGDPAAMLPALVRQVSSVDPDVPIANTVTLAFEMAGSIHSARITAAFVSYAALLAVLLTGIGLYGALAFSVFRRTKEIGIRLAVGATARGVLAMIVSEGMVVVLSGAAAGIAIAAAATRLVRHLLYGPGATDPAIYATAALLVVAVGLLSCWIPARRASKVEPVSALREQ